MQSGGVELISADNFPIPFLLMNQPIFQLKVYDCTAFILLPESGNSFLNLSLAVGGRPVSFLEKCFLQKV